MQSRSDAQSMLEQAVGEFVRGGGEITVVPSFEFKPLPQRAEVIAIDSLSVGRSYKRPSVLKSSDIRSLESVVIESGNVGRIKVMASLGLSVIQISNRTKVPRAVIRSIAKRFSFEVQESASSSQVKRFVNAL